jgi:glutamate dehydrogenase
MLQRYNDTAEYLGVSKMLERLAGVPCHDAWERTVATDLKAELKQTVGRLSQTIQASPASSCAGYFALAANTPLLEKYRRVYQEVSNAPPLDLLPLVVLAKALAKLVAG